MARYLTATACVAVLGVALAGCQTTKTADTTGSISLAASSPDSDWRQQVAILAPRYRAHPDDPDVVIPYAHALRMIGENSLCLLITDDVESAVAAIERLDRSPSLRQQK